MTDLIFQLIFSVIGGALLTACGYKMFQIYQLSSYRTKAVYNWFKSTKFDYAARYFSLAFLSFMGMFVYVGCFGQRAIVGYIGAVIFVLFSAVFIGVTAKERKKTPLRFTPRVIRCIVLDFVLSVAETFALLKLGELLPPSYAFTAIAMLFIPVTVAASHIIMAPFEKMNNAGYKRRAEKVLASNPALIKIGITGSFGKTSAKNILAKMLERKYRVAYSPASYNTPMGLSRFINNELEPNAQVFIAEMGARQRGDIRELAQMINPSYALITAIGNQHLETFGSLENIVKTKYELVENIAAGGLCVFNGDSEETKEMFNRCQTDKYLTGANGLDGAYACYADVSVGSRGTEFDMSIGGKKVHVSTKLLGQHVAPLMVACAAIAYSLGVSLDEIASACEQMEPIEHRLQLIERGETTVIDDAYNSNTQGSKNALEVLSKFDGTRIVVTPGLVELGEQESEANEELGKAIAENADIAMLIGARAQAIKNGALKSGMAEEKIFVLKSLEDATEKLKEIVGKKVVLFENDLPDNY